jgi:hypothetical protein
MNGNTVPNTQDVVLNRNLYIQNAIVRLSQMALLRREQALTQLQNIIEQQPQAVPQLISLTTSPDQVSIISTLHNGTRTLLCTLSLLISQGVSTNLANVLQERQEIPFIVLLGQMNFETLTQYCYEQVHIYFNEELYPEMNPEAMTQLGQLHNALFQFVDSAYTFLKIKYT